MFPGLNNIKFDLILKRFLESCIFKTSKSKTKKYKHKLFLWKNFISLQPWSNSFAYFLMTTLFSLLMTGHNEQKQIINGSELGYLHN